jgi:hypothetical protein
MAKRKAPDPSLARSAEPLTDALFTIRRAVV